MQRKLVDIVNCKFIAFQKAIDAYGTEMKPSNLSWPENAIGLSAFMKEDAECRPLSILTDKCNTAAAVSRNPQTVQRATEAETFMACAGVTRCKRWRINARWRSAH